MGDSALVKLAAPPAEVDSSTEDLNQILDALYGDIVMRGTDGVVTDGAGDIGQINNGRPDRIHVKTGITVGGRTLNTASFLLSKTGVQSGAAKTSGYPDFLLPAGGTDTTFDILGATTPLNMIIDGAAYSLETDLTSDALALAPSSNNTCLINNTGFTGQDLTKTIGEYGYFINIDTVGTEIIALDGKIACFQKGSEVFIGLINIAAGVILPLLRGIGGTTRETLSNNDTITLLLGHYIFLRNDLLTIDTTTLFPERDITEPTTPTSGDYWFDTELKTWKRYSGSAWEILGSIYLGYAICDSAGCKWVEHEDFDLPWNETLSYQRAYPSRISPSYDLTIDGPLLISIAGQYPIEVFSKQKILNYSDSENWESGESLVTDTWHYLYVKPTGELIISNIAPRKKGIRKGMYHPNEYWRCIYTAQNTDLNFYDFESKRCDGNPASHSGPFESVYGTIILDNYISPLASKFYGRFKTDAADNYAGIISLTLWALWPNPYADTQVYYQQNQYAYFESSVVTSGCYKLAGKDSVNDYLILQGYDISF